MTIRTLLPSMTLLAGLAMLPLTALPAHAAATQAAPAGPVATRVLAAGEVLTPADVAGPDALVDRLVGLEVKRTIYAGQPVHPADLGPPTLVERNAIVEVRYIAGALQIRTEGRALDSGGAGDLVRVMNLSSRATVTARVVGPSSLEVTP
ncbi:flagellar basal body P-ring formation chaperone FlgA [Futiania mangrovi]|uniref:Flagella basal body P-ring formation protein FlgA n=1 Tax=Futiania mangrovi TaxID=2959716 RepID=A0A9J6PC28_9PROT|nr:flagellar basal body P-ring formation chaperone FlgA [Futiania mangrovii]MCP1336829.1 flagellar basal body P-ring formation chaperone FlgA [Futiania mangrovii]